MENHNGGDQDPQGLETTPETIDLKLLSKYLLKKQLSQSPVVRETCAKDCGEV